MGESRPPFLSPPRRVADNQIRYEARPKPLPGARSRRPAEQLTEGSRPEPGESDPDRELNVDGVTVTRFERAVKKDFPQQLKLASDISDRDGLRARCRRLCVDVCDTCLDRELNVDGDTMTRFERAVKKDFSWQRQSYPTYLVETVSEHAARTAASTSAMPTLIGNWISTATP